MWNLAINIIVLVLNLLENVIADGKNIGRRRQRKVYAPAPSNGLIVCAALAGLAIEIKIDPIQNKSKKLEHLEQYFVFFMYFLLKRLAAE